MYDLETRDPSHIIIIIIIITTQGVKSNYFFFWSGLIKRLCRYGILL